MKERVLILIAFLFLYCDSNSQSFIDENYNCEWLHWRFDEIDHPTSIDTTLIDVECLIIRNQYDKGINLLDSLIKKNGDNPELYLRKAYFQADKNIFDTLYFDNFRTALELGADTSQTLYNLGAYYFNFLVACGDSTSPLKLALSDKINLINRAEKVVERAATHDKEYLSYYYEFVSLSRAYKAELRNEDLEPFPVEEPFSVEADFDTLLIMSELMDCGEFGGHIEYIKCYYDHEELKAIFWKDDPKCEIEIPKREIIENNYKRGPQSITKERLITYLSHVTSIDENPSMMTNAPTSFWIVKDNDPFFIRDWTGNSKEYETFRDEVFKK
jgi:hypothetical protein